MAVRGMSRGLAHLLLTRFNLDVGYGGGKHRDRSWLRHRTELFERYCLPSVRVQTTAQFSWLVLCSDETPSQELRRLEQLSSNTDSFTVVRCPPFRSLDMRTIIKDRIPRATRRVITTRLDNDDLIARDYLERVQTADPGSGRAAINFALGTVLDAQSGVVVRHRHYANPFISLAEPADDSMLTVFAHEHNRWHAATDVAQVRGTGAPAWMVTIHDRNVSNQKPARVRRARSRTIRRQFPSLTQL